MAAKIYDCFSSPPNKNCSNVHLRTSVNETCPQYIEKYVALCRPPGDGVFYIICVILSVLIVSGNLIVIAVFTKAKKLRNSQAIYKISIAISDILMGALILPIVVSWRFSRGNFLRIVWISGRLDAVYTLAWLITFIVSSTTLVAMGFDRMYAVLRPFQYSSRRGKQVATAVVVAIWCLAGALSVGTIKWEGPSARATLVISTTTVILYSRKIHAVFLSVAFGLLCITAVFVFTAVRYHSRNIGVHIGSSNSSRILRDRKLAITLCIMTAAFGLSVGPTIVYMLYSLVTKNPWDAFYNNESLTLLPTFSAMVKFEASVSLIFYTNSLWNCIIYSFRNKSFCDEARDIFCGCRKTAMDEKLSKRNNDIALIRMRIAE